MIDSLILNCPLLEELDVRECFSLDYIKVFGPDLRLKILTVVSGVSSIEISAPNLQSFHYCGDLFFGHSFMNISSLDDVLFNSISYEFTEPEHDYVQILTDLAHVKVLTVCDGPLLYITLRDEDKQYTWGLPITFPNVQELQLLLTSICDDTLSYVYGFFRNCFFPSLEKLFIQVPAIEMIEMDEHYNTQRMVVEEPSNCIFDNLKSIKITGFKGHRNEMRLVKFLLEKAIVLEALILIVKKDSTVYSEFTQILPLPSLHDQLVSLPKASSDARIVLCEQSDDDNKLVPTHTEVYSPVDLDDYQTAISSIQMTNVTANSM
ncbi:FBD-associated F-box protein At5g22730-like [Magnolia sinica]|uniref:FBD-associated F-box protein At5g22730-like n=1 Tax=Magnolia sinica TaxID=86752 RepID=UPI002659F2E8|nr:FBD-associated F-box protein At5g22730-like [Magnolia sinica]